VVVVEVMGSREGDNPQADDEGTDGEDPATRRTVVGSESGGFTGAENLAADADGHEHDAEDESGPYHGFPLSP
jgi:hypothetical protein